MAAAAKIRSVVKVPAIGVMVMSGLTLVLAVFSLLAWFGLAMNSADPRVASTPWPIVIPLLLVMIGCNITSLVGARRMRQLHSYKLAVVGSILFLLSPWLGLPMAAVVKPSRVIVPPIYWMTPVLFFGTWSLIALCRRDVQEAFQGHKLPGGSPLPPQPVPSAGEGALDRARQEVKGPALGRAAARRRPMPACRRCRHR